MSSTDTDRVANTVGPRPRLNLEEGRVFDEAAEQIFASIPESDRVLYAGQLVCIAPDADPSKGPRYVFGNTVWEALKHADARWGPMECLELMSFETEDGSVPKRVLEGLRGLY